MLKKILILLLIVVIFFLVYHSSCKTQEGYDGNNVGQYGGGRYGGVSGSSTPTVNASTTYDASNVLINNTFMTNQPSPTATASPTPSSASTSLDTIQNFIITRANFSDSINQMIVFLSTKNNYQDLIQKLDNIRISINNI